LEFVRYSFIHILVIGGWFRKVPKFCGDEKNTKEILLDQSVIMIFVLLGRISDIYEILCVMTIITLFKNHVLLRLEITQNITLN